MKNKFKDVIKALCRDSAVSEERYIVPCMKILLGDDGKPQDPYFDAIQFEEFLEAIWKQFGETSIRQNAHISPVVNEVLKEALFDGQGYYVPVFQAYVNVQANKQLPNDYKNVNDKLLTFYNFEKDEVFAKFLWDLGNHLDQIDLWIKKHQNKARNKIIDYTGEINLDNKGKLELAKPYLRNIEKLLKDKK